MATACKMGPVATPTAVAEEQYLMKATKALTLRVMVFHVAPQCIAPFLVLATRWWLVFFPGLFNTIAVLAFNLFGDGPRDALDPRLRGAR